MLTLHFNAEIGYLSEVVVWTLTQLLLFFVVGLFHKKVLTLSSCSVGLRQMLALQLHQLLQTGLKLPKL